LAKSRASFSSGNQLFEMTRMGNAAPARIATRPFNPAFAGATAFLPLHI
jgi:hypothetical protein